MNTTSRLLAGASFLVVMLAGQWIMAGEGDQSTTRESTNGPNESKTSTFLGVAVEPLHPALWWHLRDVIEHKQGLVVAEVAKDSPAEQAGVQVHDILMTFGTQKLFSPSQFAALVQAEKPGTAVSLGIVRDGNRQELQATLGEHTAPTMRPSGRMSAMGMRPKMMAPANSADADSNWKSFDSLALKSLGDGRFHVDVGYLDESGKVEHRTFEGTREEIRNDILAQKDLPANERQHLLRSIDMPGFDIQFDAFPGVHFSPDGRLIWGWDEIENFGPATPGDLF